MKPFFLNTLLCSEDKIGHNSLALLYRDSLRCLNNCCLQFRSTSKCVPNELIFQKSPEMKVKRTEIWTVWTPGMNCTSADDSLVKVPPDPVQRDAWNMDTRPILLKPLGLTIDLTKFLSKRSPKPRQYSKIAIAVDSDCFSGVAFEEIRTNDAAHAHRRPGSDLLVKKKPSAKTFRWCLANTNKYWRFYLSRHLFRL